MENLQSQRSLSIPLDHLTARCLRRHAKDSLVKNSLALFSKELMVKTLYQRLFSCLIDVEDVEDNDADYKEANDVWCARNISLMQE